MTTKLEQIAARLAPRMKSKRLAEERALREAWSEAKPAAVFSEASAAAYARQCSEKLAKTLGRKALLKATAGMPCSDGAEADAARAARPSKSRAKPPVYPRSSLLTTHILQVAYPGEKNPLLDRFLARLVGHAPSDADSSEPYLFENRRWLVWTALSGPVALRAMSDVQETRLRALRGVKGPQASGIGRLSRVEVLMVKTDGVVATVAADEWETDEWETRAS